MKLFLLIYIFVECGLPPEYCSFGQKDTSACKEWLKQNHNDVFSELYPDEANDGPTATDAPEEEKKQIDGEGDE